MSPGTANGHASSKHVGPHPSYIQIGRPYIFEQKLQECMSSTGVSEGKEDTIRLQGVQWIDNVRRALKLPVRTLDTAVVYYHKFRLVHADSEYGYIDAAAAALFTACKIEDTLKRSKEILCAAYNLKLPTAEHLTLDDSMFDTPAKNIVGLERLMLEASGFDYRSRNPQRLLLKLAKYYNLDRETVGLCAYNMSIDMYKTFAPLKQTTPTMAIACVELAGRLMEKNVPELEAAKGYKKWRISRPEVMETMMDLLELYTHHRTSTIVGPDYSVDIFIAIRITLNQESTAEKYPRFTGIRKHKAGTNGHKGSSNGAAMQRTLKSTISPISPRDPHPSPSARGRTAMREATVRFMLDGERAKREKKIVDEYFKEEEEEYEVEVDVEEERKKGQGAASTSATAATTTTRRRSR